MGILKYLSFIEQESTLEKRIEEKEKKQDCFRGQEIVVIIVVMADNSLKNL